MLERSCWAVVVLITASGGLGSRAYADCPGETQLEMNECAGQEFEVADKRLNDAYRKLERSPELVAAEKAWIAFRDAECKYQAKPYEGGSIQPTIYAGCLQSLTEDRIKQLEQAGLGQ